MRNSRRLAGIVALVALLLSGCSIPTTSSPNAIPANKVPFSLLRKTLPTNTPVTTVAACSVPVLIYLVNAKGVVVGLRRCAPFPAQLSTVLSELTDGPDSAEAHLGFSSAISRDVKLRSAVIIDGLAICNFNDNFESITGSGQLLAVAQVVFTATSLPGVSAVEFEVGGRPVDVPNGTGAQVSGPVYAISYLPEAGLT